MMFDSFTSVAAFVSYTILSIAPLIQTWRLYQRKQSQDISLAYSGLLVFAMTILVPRILGTHDAFLYIGHITTLLSNVLMFITAIYYRKPNQPNP